MTTNFTVGVVGNPNCGKTTLFNALTGSKQQVGNWPGVTVEQKIGEFQFQGCHFKLVDLPGTYSLDVSEGSVSIDEQIARDYVAGHEADLIINIVDASNIERNLYLTSQLIEMQVPMLVASNMMDAAEEKGIQIDLISLSKALGCPVISVIASKNKGVLELKRKIHQAVMDKAVPSVKLTYSVEIEDTINELLPQVADIAGNNRCDKRWLALRLLENDTLAHSWADSELSQKTIEMQHRIEDQMDDDIDIVTADARYEFVNSITRSAVKKTSQVQRSTSDKIDQIVLNRVLGIPIFLLAMYLMFMFTINLGSAFIDFFDILAGTILVEGLSHVINALGVDGWLVTLVANGIGGGIQVVATFIPIIGFLYLFLSVMEDSGYMARAAFVMDRFMRFIGLPGKAFVPLLVGFGCNVPAIMATRTMESHRDRVLTILMNPFMSCGARLPIYALFAAAFFPVGGQNLVFGMYLIGIGVAVLTGLIMKNTVFQGDTSPFIMELPTYHLPTLRGVLIRTWDRLKAFIFRAGKVIVPMVVVLNFLNALGTDGSFGNENSEHSVLSEIGRSITPVFYPMGLDENNWPATVGIFTGVLAKEAVVGTLDALYGQLAQQNMAAVSSQNVEEFDLAGGIVEAFETIPENLSDVADRLLDPLGLDIGDISNTKAAAAEQEVVVGTFEAMRARFDGLAGAFAYLLFILLYFPCVAATAAVYRETNLGWSIFVVSWTTGLAYMTATIFYQCATFNRHPAYSSAWIGGLLFGFAMVVLGLKLWGNRKRQFEKVLVS